MNFANLNSFYGKKQVLFDLSFTLLPGKHTILIGKNGCGKSTLLRCIAGLHPCSGSLPFFRERAKEVAYLPQFLPAVSMETERLAEMGRTPYCGITGILSPTDREKVEEALVTAGVWELRHRKVNTLSGGERQRAFLAMVLAQDTPLILLDEPTAHMDIAHAAAFMEELRLLTQNRKTILTVLHDLNLATEHADQLLLMEDGRLADPARIEEVFGVERVPYTQNGATKFFYKPNVR